MIKYRITKEGIRGWPLASMYTHTHVHKYMYTHVLTCAHRHEDCEEFMCCGWSELVSGCNDWSVLCVCRRSSSRSSSRSTAWQCLRIKSGVSLQSSLNWKDSMRVSATYSTPRRALCKITFPRSWPVSVMWLKLCFWWSWNRKLLMALWVQRPI